MNKTKSKQLKIGAALLLLILMNTKKTSAAGLSAATTILRSFLPPLESFSPIPYWDFKQWSWGYGTRVPGSTNDPTKKPAGTITRTKAMDDALAHVNNDYQYLRPLITRELKPNQWAAYLTFSYNLGTGNADNLVKNINSGDNAALELQWKAYVYAGGEKSDDLIARRAKEWNLWAS